jgi:hypothetical protein
MAVFLFEHLILDVSSPHKVRILPENTVVWRAKSEPKKAETVMDDRLPQEDSGAGLE